MNSSSSIQRASAIPVPGEGSSRARAILPGDGACDPDQPTVISQRPSGNGSPSARGTGHSDLARQLAGERLNHFQLLEYVGGGGMGAVFRALDTMLNREVALKVLSRDQGADDETRRRFQNEAQSAARLDHDNIARVYYVGEDQGLNYIVFEFIDGINLRDLVERRGPLPLQEALSYTLQIAQALAHASSRDVVHRDIKPSNVIVTAGGRAKLVDMGLARLHQVQPGGEDLTASGVTLGTFDYISPEQARDPRNADVRSDIYSLGCTLYYMLTGRPPFPDGTVLQKLLQHNSDAPPDPREFDPSLPLGVSLVVAKMLAKDPLRRYQLADELVADLVSLAEQTGCSLLRTDGGLWPVARPATAPSSSLVRHLPWMVPVGLLLLIAILADRPFGSNDPLTEASMVARLQERSRRVPKSGNDGAADRESAVTPAAAASGTNNTPEKATPGAMAVADKSAPSKSATEADDQDGTQQTRVDVANKIGSKAAVDGDPRPPTAVRPSPGGSEGGSNQNPRADSTTAEPTKVASEVLMPSDPPPEGLLVVGDGLVGPRRYASLAEACAAAKNSEVIELRYDGPRDEIPLVLNNQRLEIRAGAARHPAIVFRPDDTNPSASDRTMFSVSGGSLRASGIEIELDLSQAPPSENWSLFTLDQASSLRLEQCSLTVRNATASGLAYHDKVAFFHTDSSPAADPMVLMPKGMSPLPPVQIALNNCFVRGEADLLADRDLKPLDFKCINGLLTISGRVLAAGEGAAMPQEGSRLRIELDHVTALVRQGLCRMAASELAPGMPEVEIRLSDSVLFSDGADPVLVEHAASGAADRLQAVFHWEAFDSLYLGFRTFWKIGLPISREGVTKTYTDWTDLWPLEKARTRAVPLTWRLPAPRRPLNAATAADFSGDLDAQIRPLALFDSSDRPAGVDFQLLPAARLARQER